MSLADKLREYGVLVAINLVAAAAGVLLLTSVSWRIGASVGALALIAVGAHVLSRFGPLAARSGGHGGATLPAQIMLVAAAAGACVRARPQASTLPVALAAGMIALLVAEQPLIAFLADPPRLTAVRLPGYRPGRVTSFEPRGVWIATLVLIALLGFAAITDRTAWPVVAAAGVVAAAALVLLAEGVRHRTRGSIVDKPFRAALEAYEPAFALHFSAPDNTEYHVAMWLPYLERVGKPFVIVTREPGPYRRLAEATKRPVIYCPEVRFLDQVVVDSLRAVFYVNNGALNTHLVRFAKLTHIQLLHGDSDKASSYNPVTAMYDRVFVAGQAGIDRYGANGVDIPAERFDIVGRPQVESVHRVERPIAQVKSPTVLYATTWIGVHTDAPYCSLPIGEKIIKALLARGATVIMRPHPYSARHTASALQVSALDQILTEDRAKSGRKHVTSAAASAMALFDCFNSADALVSDVSGVASDWLASRKPFALTNMPGRDAGDFVAEFPLARAAYVIDRDGGNTAAVLDELLGKDPLADTRREVSAYYLGESVGADGFLAAARKYTG